MYLRHYDNDQNGPTFSGGGGGGEGVASGSTKPQNWKKNTFKTATKIRLKPKIASKPSEPIFHILVVKVSKLGNLRSTINTKTVKPKFVWYKTEKPI